MNVISGESTVYEKHILQNTFSNTGSEKMTRKRSIVSFYIRTKENVLKRHFAEYKY